MTDDPWAEFRTGKEPMTAEPPAAPDTFSEFRTPRPEVIPNRVFGELKPTEFSYTQRLKQAAQAGLEYLGANRGVAQHLGGAAVNIGGMTPMGSVLSAAELTRDVPNIVQNPGNIRNYGSAALDALGVAPGALAATRAIRGMPKTIPTYEPPPFATRGPPASVAGTPPEAMGWVTPSTAELVGRGSRYGEPLGAAQRGYEAIRNAPLRYSPEIGEDIAALAKKHIEHADIGGFSPEKAPLVHQTLDRFAKNWKERGKAITPDDLDTFRQQLRGLEGPNGPAGNRAVDILDLYMTQPPPNRLVAGTQQDLAAVRDAFAQARGDYRAGKTAQTVEEAIDRAGTRAGSTYSGMNIDNATRQRLAAFSTTDAGQNRLFGATQPERLAVWQASQGDPTTNLLRTAGNRLAGGGGAGSTVVGSTLGAGATGLSHLAGADPYVSAAIGVGTGVGAAKAGSAFRRAANERTVQAAEDVAAQIRRNSPEYAARLAASGGPVTDPRSVSRDAIAYALIPTIRNEEQNWWR